MRRYQQVRLRHQVGPGDMWLDSFQTEGIPVPRYDDYVWRSALTPVSKTGEAAIWCQGCAASFAIQLRPYQLRLSKACGLLVAAVLYVAIVPYLGLQGLIYLAEMYTSSLIGGLLNFATFVVLCVLIVIPTTMIIIGSVYNLRRIWRKLRGRPIAMLTPRGPLPLFLGVEHHHVTFR